MVQSDVSAKAQECQDFCLAGWVKLIHLQDSVTAWYLLRGEVWGSKAMGDTTAALGRFLACFIQPRNGCASRNAALRNQP